MDLTVHSVSWTLVILTIFYLFFRVTVSFIDRDGDKMTVSAKIGDSLLDVAKDNDLDLEGKYAEFYHLINFKEMPSLYVSVI